LLSPSCCKLVCTEAVLIIFQKCELAFVDVGILLDLVYCVVIPDSLSECWISATMSREYLGECNGASLRGPGGYFGGDAEVQRVLAPEVRNIGVASIAFVDGVTRPLNHNRVGSGKDPNDESTCDQHYHPRPKAGERRGSPLQRTFRSIFPERQSIITVVLVRRDAVPQTSHLGGG